MNMDAPPFPRGETLVGLSDPSTVDTTGLAQLEGMEWVFPDLSWNTSAGNEVSPARSNRPVRCRVVRNVSGGALLPKRAVKPNTGDATGVSYGNQALAHAALGDPILGVVDEFLPAAGVPANYMFWCVIDGPSTMTTDATGTTTIASGKEVIPGPAANGTVVAQDVTVVTATNIYNQLQSAVGRCMQAVAAISTDFLVDVRAHK